MSECKKCIERAQTIRWLNGELERVTQQLAGEIALREGVAKETDERIKLKASFKIDAAKALADLKESAEKRRYAK